MGSINRKEFIFGLGALSFMAKDAFADAQISKANRLVKSAAAQIGVTVQYDPAYTVLKYPGGDVPRFKGVCTDVVIRAYRDALGIDLQQLVHDDMAANFAKYPKNWGLKGADKNIDHRRVPNLRRFFERRGAELAVSDKGSEYREGDIITQSVQGLAHIGIVSGDKALLSGNPLIIHNIGRGTQKEDVLFAFPITGHYRFGV